VSKIPWKLIGNTHDAARISESLFSQRSRRKVAFVSVVVVAAPRSTVVDGTTEHSCATVPWRPVNKTPRARKAVGVNIVKREPGSRKNERRRFANPIVQRGEQ